MKYFYCFLSSYFISLSACCQATKTQIKGIGIAFYNVENLFDTIDDPDTWDVSFTPKGKYHWTADKLEAKIDNLALVISKLGAKELGQSPSFIGIAEVENRKVLELLVGHTLLLPYDYGIEHFNSPDGRGIDVALLYRRDHFLVQHSQKHRLDLKDENDAPILTRDQLCVSGMLDREQLFFIINHWPSRRGGVKRSEQKRLLAAELSKKISDSIYRIDQKANIIVMGDFNDNPTDKSFKKVLQTKGEIIASEINYFYNPFEAKFKKGFGSLAYRDKWFLFDQILLSNHLTDSIGWQYLKSLVYKPSFLQNKKGKYKGYPKRSAGNKFGYSDHFPIYMVLGKSVNP